jgi:hypothetical protein
MGQRKRSGQARQRRTKTDRPKAVAGAVARLSPETSLRVRWSAEIIEQVSAFLRTRDPGRLVQLLETHPIALAHPVVFRRVLQLSRLRRLPDEGDLGAGYVTTSESVPPAGTRQAADAALQRLVTAWVAGLLGLGWTLKSPAGRPGRKRSPDDIAFDFWLLDLYQDLLRRLKPETVRRTKQESPEQWATRLADVIHRVWEQSWVSKEIETTRETDTIEERTLPLPDATAREWASGAVELAAEGPIRDRIAYALIGHRWDMTPDQVRGRIQATRRLDKATE